MPDAVTLFQLAAVTICAAAVQGAAGFAFGLIAMPAYLWILGSADAVPLVIIVSLTISTVLVGRIRRSVNRALLTRFVVGAGVGIPLGLALFWRAETDQLLLGVALVMLAFVGYVALGGRVEQSGEGDPEFSSRDAAGIGSLAGAMTMALGMPGPPIMLYMTGIRVPKDSLRATALAFFAVSYASSLGLQSVTVGVGAEVWLTAAVLLPAACVGGFIGNLLSRFVSEVAFRKVVLGLLTLIGVSTLLGVLVP